MMMMMTIGFLSARHSIAVSKLIRVVFFTKYFALYSETQTKLMKDGVGESCGGGGMLVITVVAEADL
jgi:hypothetical protein